MSFARTFSKAFINKGLAPLGQKRASGGDATLGDLTSCGKARSALTRLTTSGEVSVVGI